MTGIDISPAMAEIAKEKFAAEERVPLPSTEELRSYLEEELEIIVSVDTEDMFQLTGQAPAAK